MQNKIKVLHIIPAFGGGISSFVKNLICVSTDDDVSMDVTGFGSFPSEYVEKINNYDGAVYSLVNSHRHPIQFFKQYINLLKSNNYDLVHCHFSGIKGLIFKLLAKCVGVKFIATHAHRSDDEKKGPLFSLTIKISRIASILESDMYFTCSDSAAEYIYGRKFAHNNEIIMLPNTIELYLYTQETTSDQKRRIMTELGILDNAYIICHIGRFNKQKNHSFLIDIADSLRKKNNNFVFLLVGDGQDLETIKSIVKNRHLDDYFVFAGKRNDVPDILRLSNLFVLPSLFEGLPTVAVESQAAGTFTIMSDTITKQADLGMGLVKFLSISNGPDIWADEILWNMNHQYRSMNLSDRTDILCNKCFINNQMRKKYVHVLKKYKVIDDEVCNEKKSSI